jgi:hypothetical protein
MSNYKDILGSTLKLNKIEEEQIRSTRFNVWLENDSSLTSGIAENSTLSSSSESRVSSVTEAIMTELVDGFKRGASAMVRIIINELFISPYKKLSCEFEFLLPKKPLSNQNL